MNSYGKTMVVGPTPASDLAAGVRRALEGIPRDKIVSVSCASDTSRPGSFLALIVIEH
jgi:hypothetical protein